ncbi:MAG: TolC family protein [Polyangiaceae bacterium]|jgi:outer membrane protein|nr:TolC family protein [Polyangiaceae bacterium]
MNSGRTPRFCSFIMPLILAAWIAPSSSHAQAPPRQLHEEQALRMAIDSNPSLRSAVLELQRAAESVRLEDHRYPYSLQLDAGATHTETPTVQNVNDANSIDLGAELSRTFPTGTRASVRVEGYRETTTRPGSTINTAAGPVAMDATTSGPTYGTLARASVAQPLLRGAGREVGESGLRVARIARDAAALSRDTAASQTARDVQLAYWELWYAQTSLSIEQGALALAVRQRDEASQKVKDGALAPVELLSFETRIAAIEEAVVSARSQRRQRALSLAEAIGDPSAFGEDLLASTEQSPTGGPLPRRASALEEARAKSPEVMEAKANLRLAEEQLTAAGDSYRSRLDLEGYVQVAGIGDQQVPPALEQLARGRATSAHVGLVYELPLGDDRRVAERSRQLLAIRVAQQRLRAAEQRVRAELESVFEEESAARRRLELAQETVRRAELQLKAQQERYEIGVAIPIEVREAEDELRQARQRAERARVDVAEAEIRRTHLTGELLQRVASQVNQAPVAAR